MWNSVRLLFAATCCSITSSVIGCNKALCASDVSKCLLQELCQCQVTAGDCPCCRECTRCLGTAWDQCCNCVGLCRKDRGAGKPPARRSSLGGLPSPVPSLFQALSGMQERDSAPAWKVEELPMSEELAQLTHTDHVLLGAHTGVSRSPPASGNVSSLCTVLYFNPCMSMSRCRQACESVGSGQYRWFHNGCCQCVGPDCHGYGSKKPACQQCHR
ncbi:twisted gastrulation protein homolog 1-like [Ascaphus truei]|uniref:twisted gastrulation protein homolog 1-like n=1 Tax=Ascaphus truei TaxID=8439 RepID=UPI003F59E5B6